MRGAALLLAGIAMFSLLGSGLYLFVTGQLIVEPPENVPAPTEAFTLFLLLESLVSVWTVHWQLVVGAVFMVCVLFFPRGIWGTLTREWRS